MSVQPKATLKSYFETGDKPTQANFEDLIDSLLDQSDGIKNGGNSFGADASVGTNDNYAVSHIAHNIEYARGVTSIYAGTERPQLLLPLGNSVKPAIGFIDESGTGFYRRFAGQLGIAINGGDGGYFQSSGLTFGAGGGVSAGYISFITNTSPYSSIKNSSFADIIKFPNVTSAVNYFKISNASTGNVPVLQSAGTDTNIGISYVTKGTGVHTFTGDISLSGNLANTSTGYLQVAAGTTAQEPTASNGMLRYDSTTNKLRAVENGSWVDVISTGLSSPLTTKGDLWGYSTGDTRIAVGTDDYFLVADSTQSAGVTWKRPKFYYADESGTSTSAYFLTSNQQYGMFYGGGNVQFKQAGMSKIVFDSVGVQITGGLVRTTAPYSMGIGTDSYGTGGQNVFVQKNGVAPGNVTDCFHMYSLDITAGNAAPHFQTENGDVIKLYKQSALTSADSSSLNSGDATTDTVIANMRTRINELETILQNLGLL